MPKKSSPNIKAFEETFKELQAANQSAQSLLNNIKSSTRRALTKVREKQAAVDAKSFEAIEEIDLAVLRLIYKAGLGKPKSQK
ncbi:hypothetical protein CMO96_01405 [Candidatus Woesebacteria bacterium]|nr:hypothetical protein [Candidatus Woesebacteria bacterium]|tara:strand:+ start:1546 stop:1794 length:249 start_codon:yes stop_codon:yes gene_type:complete